MYLDEILRLNQLEREHRKVLRTVASLKEQLGNVELLREENRSLQDKIARYGPVHERCGELEVR